MRMLASIQRISKLETIPNADQLLKATVLGWEVVVKKEGIVIRPKIEHYDSDLHCQLVHNRISFKAVNPEFLLKFGE
jgi:hypothetical protein